jgi:hypothetical protein
MIPIDKRISAGDPDASFYKRKHGEKSKLGYQNAFCTDIKEGIITRVITISGGESMADTVELLLKDFSIPELTLDAEFSLGKLIALAQGKGIILNVPRRALNEHNVYPKTMFKYDYDLDVYICPQGKQLNLCSKYERFSTYRGTVKGCKNCPVLIDCTKAKTKVRTIKRDMYELDLELHEEYIQSNRYQFAKILRGILAEGKFSEANLQYGLKNARYVGKILMAAQAKMTAVVINIKRFLKVIYRREKEQKIISEKSRSLVIA